MQKKLDRGSIRSSPRYGLSTPYRLIVRNSARLFQNVLFNMGDLNLVLPLLNLSPLNAGIFLWGVGLEGGPYNFSVSPRPLGFGFWTKEFEA